MQLYGFVLKTGLGYDLLGQRIGRRNNYKRCGIGLNGGQTAQHLGTQYLAGIVLLAVLDGAAVGRGKEQHLFVANGLDHVVIKIGGLFLVIQNSENARFVNLLSQPRKEQRGR